MKSLFLVVLFPIVFGTSSFEKTTPKIGAVHNIDGKPFAIVQLFTSEGCSSCPSADLVLEDVKNKYSDKNVFVLSYHVDYWNRLGWKDVFSKKEYSDLQYRYSSKFNESSVYTPQAIVNGGVQFVGSDQSKMNGMLSKYLKDSPENTIALSEIEKSGKLIIFHYDVEGELSGNDLKVALVIAKRNTEVKRGENSGRKLTSVNIVVEQVMISLDKKTGKSKIEIPEIVNNDDKLSLIAFSQNKSFEITGATQEKI